MAHDEIRRVVANFEAFNSQWCAIGEIHLRIFPTDRHTPSDEDISVILEELFQLEGEERVQLTTAQRRALELRAEAALLEEDET